MSSTSKRDIIEKLNEFLHCFICKNEISDVKICPNCCQLLCYPCINKRLLSIGRDTRCPNCNKAVDMLEFVNCPWADKIMSYVKTFKAEICSTHSEDISIYCVSCTRGVCYRCVLWEGIHSDHTIRPLKELYENELKLLKDEVTSLSKLWDVTDFFLEEMTQIQHVTNLIRNCAKSEFISKTAELWSIIAKLKKTIMLRIPQSKLEPVSSPAIIPSHYGDTHTFVVHPFSQLQQKGDPVYSDLFCDNGLCWRMIVYPNGNEDVRGDYLSVFLELCAGYLGKSNYRYRLIMRNQAKRDSSENYIRRYISEFRAGQSNGDRRYCRLDLLTRGGYLNQILDTLELAFQVKTPNFYQVCYDKQLRISQIDCNEAGSSKSTGNVPVNDQ